MSYFEFPHTRNYDSDLGWLIKTVKKLVECCNEMTDWKETHEEEYKNLKKLYDDILAGRFPDSMINSLNLWLKNNMPEIIKDMIKHVFFGLNDDGYFVAYIPDSWEDIIFNTTGLDILIPDFEYGRLVLSY